MEVVFVLGQSLKPDGTVPSILQKRLETAVQLYRERKAKLLVSGADMSRVGKSEARAMSEILMQQFGVAQEDIILEEEAVSTVWNMIKIVPIIQDMVNRQQQQVEQSLGKVKVFLVTSDFHMPRSCYAFRAVFRHFKLLDEIDFLPHPAPNGIDVIRRQTPVARGEVGADFIIKDINDWDLQSRLEHELAILRTRMDPWLLEAGITSLSKHEFEFFQNLIQTEIAKLVNE